MDSFAVLGAVAASVVIVVNAIFLQSGSHPAPFLAVLPPAAPAPMAESRPVATHPAPAPNSVNATRAPPPVGERRYDPIAELIGPSPRILAVQHALSDYGYGQIKPSGILDLATSSAIEKFEREHKLPVTGRISDRLVSDLAAMIGHPVQ